jgi:transposase
MSPEYVRSYVKSQKNDDRDAEAVAEAATRPTMRFVEVKSEAQPENARADRRYAAAMVRVGPRVAELDKELAEWARNEEAARRLMSIPGIGVLNATALIAAIGQGEGFARGRDLAAWLGLVPRQVTTGGRPRLVGISKRGNKYLRKLLIHGARAALPTLLKSPTSLGAWLRGLMARMHKNAAVVALANKLARIAWAVIRHAKTFSIAVPAVA